MVLVAAPDLIPRLKAKLAEPNAELLTFSDTDALRALEAILKRKPNVVALERLFSATPRGTALVNRIKADPTLTQAEIRIIGQDGAATVISSVAATGAPAPAAPAPVAPAPAAPSSSTPTPAPRASPAPPPATAAPGKPAAATATPAKVVDVWGGPQPRRVDTPVSPAAPMQSIPALPVRAPVADAKKPAEPVAEAASAESPADAMSLAAEIELAETELSAEWMIEPMPEAEPVVTADVEVELELEIPETEPAVEAASAAGKAPEPFEVVTNAGSVVVAREPQAPAVEPVVTKSGSPAAIAPAEGQSGKHAAPAATAPVVAPLLDQTGTRRAPRFKMNDAAGLLLDGATAKLVDLSTIGAQVLSSTVLKPNQRVRIALTDKQGAVKISGSVAWALFEIPPRYRAGIAFVDADPAAVETFSGRHKQAP